MRRRVRGVVVDGVPVGGRVLVSNQADPSKNGIYIALGDVIVAGEEKQMSTIYTYTEDGIEYMVDESRERRAHLQPSSKKWLVDVSMPYDGWVQFNYCDENEAARWVALAIAPHVEW